MPDLSARPLPPALSEDYSDIIVRYPVLPDTTPEVLARYQEQPVNNQYSILYAPLSENLSTVEQIGYSAVPKLFTAIDTVSLEASGILAVQQQPFLSLKGQGVLLGFLDSGIDYTHPAFRLPDGRTRILRIWDQNDTRGLPPEGLSYGSEFTQEQINDALLRPGEDGLIPERDPDGHGTAVAGIACGSADAGNDFTGAAPDASIVFVRLKQAKQYLRNYFLIPPDAPAYQENDLMLGVRYLTDVAAELSMPLVICCSTGTSQGGHTGTTPLEDVLSAALFAPGICAVAGTGNEAGRGHHYLGQLSRAGDFTDVEVLVDQETAGFTMEFWADAPELYSIGFTSPLGEVIRPVQPRSGTTRDFSFLLESSRISVTFTITEMLSGSQLIQMRFLTPAPGIWRIRVVSEIFVSGIFHIWLPISGLTGTMIRFYSPDVDTTLVIPSCAQSVLSVGSWNAQNNSLFLNSGRGYTRNGLIKPDFASPGVEVSCPAPGARYTALTGSCAASAMASGAAALLLEAGLKMNPPRYLTATEIKSLLIRGAGRSGFYTYPNREWGYGTMNVYGIFEAYQQA